MKSLSCIAACAMMLLLGCTHRISPLRTFATPAVTATAIAWSADEKLIAFGEPSGNVTVWDIESGALIAQTSGYVSSRMLYEVSGMAFSPDAQFLAFGAEDDVSHVWDFRAGTSRNLHGLPGPLLTATFSPDCRRLISASGGMIYPWLPTTRAATRPHLPERWPSPVIQPMRVVTFDVDSQAVASSVDASGMINISISRDGELFAGTKVAVTKATTWPLAPTAPETHSGRVEVCSTRDGACLHSFPATAWWNDFSPDGKVLRAGMTLWNIESKERVRDISFDARAFADGGQRMLLVHAIGSKGSPWSLIIPVGAIITPNVKISYLDLSSGSRKDLGEFEPSMDDRFASAFATPANVSPSGRYAANSLMKLWQVPR